MHHSVVLIARVMAVLGALVLSFLIVMTCVSITGRELNSFFNSDAMQAAMPGLANWFLAMGIGPVTGDFELIENGMPFAIFAFLPLTQITAGHATVDVFTSRFPPRVLRWMAAVTEVVFAVVLIVFAYKLYEGLQGKMRYNEVTYLIQFPVWWAYALALVAAVIAALVAVYMAGIRVTEAWTGTMIVREEEVEH